MTAASIPSPAVHHRAAPRRVSALARLPWLLALEALALVILVYPLRLREDWLLARLKDWSDRSDHGDLLAKFSLDQFESFISFYHSPLIQKGVIAGICGLAFILLMAARLVLRPALDPAVTDGEDGSPPPRAWTFLWWLAFVLFSAASILWSPTPALSLEGLPYLMGLGGLGFALLRRGVSRSELRQLALLLIGLGALVALISLLEATELFHGAIFNFMFKFDDAFGRNLYGSIIGHNNGVASYLLMTLFPAFAFAVDGRSLPRRALAAAYLTLAILTIVVVQSRAIWVLGLLLGPAFAWLVFRQRGRRWPWRLTAYAGFFVVVAGVTQLVDAPWNPLVIRTKVPLRERLSHLTPAHLQTSTQWRCLVCSLPLVAQRPILGHGLYAFQYVYPKAQADYYQRHPDHGLSYTEMRSHMAHNEYLQALIEHGAVGLALLVLALGEIFWRARGLNRRLAAEGFREVRLLHAAFTFSALALALHASLDFPLHIPQLVVPWLFCVAGCASLRLPEDESGTEETDVPESEFILPRSERLGRLAMAFILVALIPLAAYPLARAYQADIEFMSGQAILGTIRSGARLPPDVHAKLMALAETRLRRALELQPAHDTARYELGEFQFFKAYDLIGEERRNPPGVPQLYQPAIHAAQDGVELVQQSMLSFRYHLTYVTLANFHNLLASISDAKDRPGHLERQRRALETALYFCPRYVQAAEMLAQLLDRQTGAGARQRALELRRMIRLQDGAFFFGAYDREFNRRFRDRDYEGAVAGAETLLAVDPSEPLYLSFAIDTNMWARNRERALALIQAFRKIEYDRKRYPVSPYYATFGGLYEAILLGRWDDALLELDHTGQTDAWTAAWKANIEAYAREKAGRAAGIPSRYVRPEELTEAQWANLLAEQKAIFLYRMIGDAAAAKPVFELRAAVESEEPSIRFWIEYAYLARELKDKALLTTCLKRIQRLDRDYFARNRGIILLRPPDPVAASAPPSTSPSAPSAPPTGN